MPHGLLRYNNTAYHNCIAKAESSVCCRARRQEAARGQAAYELELWMENMVQLGKGTTKHRCVGPANNQTLPACKRSESQS